MTLETEMPHDDGMAWHRANSVTTCKNCAECKPACHDWKVYTVQDVQSR